MELETVILSEVTHTYKTNFAYFLLFMDVAFESSDMYVSFEIPI